MSLDELHAFLVGDIEEGLFATGGQFYVSVGGVPVADWAFGVDGVGNEVTTSTLFSVYCSCKPVFAVALGCLVDDGELSLDDRLGHVIDRPLPATLTEVLVGDILSHTAGLHDLDIYVHFGTSVERQPELVTGVAPPPGWRAGVDVGYGQIAGWELLGWAVEDLTGMATRDLVAKRVLEPLDLQEHVFVAGMGPDQFARHRDRLGINTFLSGRTATPILSERNRRLRCATSPASAGTASARGLGRFYEALLAIRQTRDGVVSTETLRRLTSLRSHGDDVVLGRRCGYGHGFMVQLAEHEFGARCGPASFGHSAYGGINAAFCDPERELVVALHFNGRVDAESAVSYHRPALVDRVYRLLFGT